MLVVMKAQATPEEIQAVCDHIVQLGFRPHPLPGAQRTAIGITGNQGEVDRGNLESLSGVAEVIRVSKAYKLASRDVKEEDTVVRFGATGNPADGSSSAGWRNGVAIGGRDLAIVAGPCSIESREQAFAIAEQVAQAGAQFFRGGAYKPRTSPYAFQGLGLEALKIMSEIRERLGLRIVTEALDSESLDLVAEWADVIQIGARNMQNFSLLKKAGRLRKPVLLKRGLSATMEEFLMAAEYVMSEGNYEVILCERGVRTFADHARNTLDLSIVPALQHVSHLPILVDPSHGTGRRDSVLPMARAAIAAGADGVMVEVHDHPERALSDGPQSVYPAQFAEMMHELEQIAPVVGRNLARGVAVDSRQ
jgi:3-deoxy-7-phosphoheptulonate synthase